MRISDWSSDVCSSDLLGALHAPHLSREHTFWFALLTGCTIGFYDGFFGPGTGSFLIFAFVGLFGFSFLAASASAKMINLTTNLAALVYFVTHAHVRYEIEAQIGRAHVCNLVTNAHLVFRLVLEKKKLI